MSGKASRIIRHRVVACSGRRSIISHTVISHSASKTAQRTDAADNALGPLTRIFGLSHSFQGYDLFSSAQMLGIVMPRCLFRQPPRCTTSAMRSPPRVSLPHASHPASCLSSLSGHCKAHALLPASSAWDCLVLPSGTNLTGVKAMPFSSVREQLCVAYRHLLIKHTAPFSRYTV